MVGGAQAVAALATVPRPFRVSTRLPGRVTLCRRCQADCLGRRGESTWSLARLRSACWPMPRQTHGGRGRPDGPADDPLAACYLVTCDEQFAREVEAGIDILVTQSPRAEITRLARQRRHHRGGRRYGCRRRGREFRGARAPGLHCKDAMGLLGGIRNAGAIFVGAWAPSRLAIMLPAPTTRCRPAARPYSPTRFRSKSSLSARCHCYTPEGLLSDAPATRSAEAEAEACGRTRLSAALRRRVLEQGEDAVKCRSRWLRPT